MYSMTGFASGTFQWENRTFNSEIRSVNNRFLDIKVRLPWSDGELERRILTIVRRQISRGRVDLSVCEKRCDGLPGQLQINKGYAQCLAQGLRELAEVLGCDLNTAAFLIAPQRELIETEDSPGEQESFWRLLSEALKGTLDKLLEMRSKEGEVLGKELVAQSKQIEQHVSVIRVLAKDEPERYRKMLFQRLDKMPLEQIDLDSQRLTQEVALIADRIDITEELARIGSHLAQLHDIQQLPGPVGRKIEFLLQELNRELTTIGSKTLNVKISHHVVEAKACVEKMREQSQNLE